MTLSILKNCRGKRWIPEMERAWWNFQFGANWHISARFSDVLILSKFYDLHIGCKNAIDREAMHRFTSQCLLTFFKPLDNRSISQASVNSLKINSRTNYTMLFPFLIIVSYQHHFLWLIWLITWYAHAKNFFGPYLWCFKIRFFISGIYQIIAPYKHTT